MWELTIENLTHGSKETFKYTTEDMIEKLEILDLNIDEVYTVQYIA